MIGRGAKGPKGIRYLLWALLLLEGAVRVAADITYTTSLPSPIAFLPTVRSARGTCGSLSRWLSSNAIAKLVS